MRDAGINARAIAGQWAHNYPDQPDRHSSLGSGYGGEAYPNMSRMDWAVELYGWFQYYLKDIGEEPEPWSRFKRMMASGTLKRLGHQKI